MPTSTRSVKPRSPPGTTPARAERALPGGVELTVERLSGRRRVDVHDPRPGLGLLSLSGRRSGLVLVFLLEDHDPAGVVLHERIVGNALQVPRYELREGRRVVAL